MACAIPLMIIYSVLETNWRKEQAKRHVRRVLMQQIEREKEFEERSKRIAPK